MDEVGGYMRCRECGTYHDPAQPEQPLATEKLGTMDVAIPKSVELAVRREKIRVVADRFVIFSSLLLLAGFLTFVLSLKLIIEGEDSTDCWIALASLVGSAFWLFLGAQIIYIRANTEK